MWRDVVQAECFGELSVRQPRSEKFNNFVDFLAGQFLEVEK